MSFANSVAVVRNGFCVAKTLLPKEHFLQQIVQNGPLKNVKIVEYIVGIAQIIGVLLNLSGGFSNVVTGLKEYNGLKSILASIDKLAFSGGTFGSAEYTILRQGAVADRNAARTKMLTGFCKFNIGTGFIFLVMNTLHLTGPTHPLPLFKALIVIELSLFTILFVLLNSIVASFVKAKKLFTASTGFQRTPKRLNTYQRMCLAADAGFDDNLLETLQLVKPSFAPGFQSQKTSTDAIKQDLVTVSDFLSEPDETDSSAGNLDIATDLRKKSVMLTYTTVLESIFLVLNGVAFYGYLLGVMAYFFPAKDINFSSLQGQLLSFFMLGLSHSEADFFGFLAGDMAWTVEPMLALCVPFLMKYFAAQVDKILVRDKKHN